MIKRVLCWIFIIPLLLLSTPLAHAEDGDLDFNTDELKNKSDDYSSLTDINGLNLFTTDTQELIKEEEILQTQENVNDKNELFTNQYKQTEDKEIKLFTVPISFDKTSQAKDTLVSISLIVMVLTMILGCFVFAITRKYYKQKEAQNDETDFNIYK